MAAVTVPRFLDRVELLVELAPGVLREEGHDRPALDAVRVADAHQVADVLPALPAPLLLAVVIDAVDHDRASRRRPPSLRAGAKGLPRVNGGRTRRAQDETSVGVPPGGGHRKVDARSGRNVQRARRKGRRTSRRSDILPEPALSSAIGLVRLSLLSPGPRQADLSGPRRGDLRRLLRGAPPGGDRLPGGPPLPRRGALPGRKAPGAGRPEGLRLGPGPAP